ncbi:unnamed protein product [Cyprideis torosa]|uniref:Uncharacterized protein n=1 Tax=Cyprideis torosa TaxID=163714 RepID=A0A7R8ZW56_9CRUS|nr:unnamed protein product [Cyprideis torosa]CAG0904595.1 unnamed protein product [Cyprideis torosa]
MSLVRQIPNIICGAVGVMCGITGTTWGLLITTDYANFWGHPHDGCIGLCDTWFIMCMIATVFWALHIMISIFLIVGVCLNDRFWCTPFPFSAFMAAVLSCCVFIGGYDHGSFEDYEYEYRWVLAPACINILCITYIIVAWCVGLMPKGWSPVDTICNCGLGGP